MLTKTEIYKTLKSLIIQEWEMRTQPRSAGGDERKFDDDYLKIKTKIELLEEIFEVD